MSDITDIKIKTLLMDIDFVSRLIDGLEDESVDVIKKLISHYEATKDGQWIDRSKQNPKERGQYLVYRAGCFQRELANFGTSKGWDNGRYRLDNPYRVTHWQPLPLPPQTTSEDD